MALYFRPRPGPTLAALLGLALTASACIWQWGRGLEKDRIEAQLGAAADGARIALGAQPVAEQAVRYRRVVARGEFVPEAVVFLDNQVRGTIPGYVVFMPLRLGDSQRHVLVKRGWVAAPADRAIEPSVRTPSGQVELAGVALPPSARFLELSASTQAGRLWQNVTLDRVAAASRLAFQPLILEQQGEFDDGLVRDWPRPAHGSAKHYGYAFQWGAMAVTIVILYVVLNVRRNPPPPSAP
jgi:surfeit locus 1 family protein